MINSNNHIVDTHKLKLIDVFEYKLIEVESFVTQGICQRFVI